MPAPSCGGAPPARALQGSSMGAFAGPLRDPRSQGPFLPKGLASRVLPRGMWLVLAVRPPGLRPCHPLAPDPLRPPGLRPCHPLAPDPLLPSGSQGDPVCIGFCTFYRWGGPGLRVKQTARGPHLARPGSSRPTGQFPAPHWGPPTWLHASPGGRWGRSPGRQQGPVWAVSLGR